MKPSKLASRLALARAVTGLIQTELAAMTGVSLNQIKHLENGDYEMSVRYAWVFSQELGVSSQWLIGVGSPDVPIGLDGQEFTQKQFIQARAYHSEKDKSGISKHVLHHMSEEEIESARTAFKNLLYDRSVAWKAYLHDLVDGGIDDTIGDRLAELLGVQIAESMRKMPNWGVEFRGPKYEGIDDAMRFLRAKKKSDPKRSKATKARF